MQVHNSFSLSSQRKISKKLKILNHEWMFVLLVLAKWISQILQRCLLVVSLAVTCVTVFCWGIWLSTEKKTTLHTFKNKYNSDVATIVALTVAAAYLFWLPSSSRLQFLSSCRCCCLLVLTVVFTEAVIVTVNWRLGATAVVSTCCCCCWWWSCCCWWRCGPHHWKE